MRPAAHVGRMNAAQTADRAETWPPQNIWERKHKVRYAIANVANSIELLIKKTGNWRAWVHIITRNNIRMMQHVSQSFG